MTINPNHVAVRSVDPRRILWNRWVALWNGDLAIADEIVAADVLTHLPAAGSAPGSIHGRQALTDWISTIRSTCQTLRWPSRLARSSAHR